MAPAPLALLLLRASRWFDRQLLDGLQREGWPMLSPAQSLVFAHLDAEGVPPAELARRLGHTRQATQDLLVGLVRLDLVALEPNPERRGGRLVVLTDRGRVLTADAQRLLTDLEESLGAGLVDQLRGLLLTLNEGCNSRSESA
jgi:DNA-binding MarR family transcriptional regulator